VNLRERKNWQKKMKNGELQANGKQLTLHGAKALILNTLLIHADRALLQHLSRLGRYYNTIH
jgi:hypothetical protein